MVQQTLTIKQGDSTTFTEAITGIDSLAGFTAKMYIKTSAGVEVDTITGAYDVLTITYEIVNNDSKLYPVENHHFETKIFDGNDIVATPSEGLFIVEKALVNDPS